MTQEKTPWVPIITLGALCLGGYLSLQWMLAPLISPSDFTPPPPAKIIDIPEGTTLRQLASQLEREDLIKSQWTFLMLGKLTLSDRHIMAGEYAFHAGMGPGEILSDVLSGHVVLHQVTIPEGYTVAQIADLLGQKRLADTSEFVRLARERDFIRSLNLNVASLEGYLFPDTYRFTRHTKAGDLLKEMVERLWQTFTPELGQRAQAVRMSMHQVLTLASVIEKETSAADERAFISAVFHNRLRKGVPLQSDPTVIYGLEHFDGNLRKRDLDSKSPYNTYRVRGLPPGPIANPGLESIRAALYPAPTSYLYFVSRNDGTHQFSSTLAEHNRAVGRYQRRSSLTTVRQPS